MKHGNRIQKDKAPPRIFQFKITLKGARSAIWRRIQINARSTFWDLHVAIQCAMDGWIDCHLHGFTITMPKQPLNEAMVHIGMPIPDDPYRERFLMESETYIDDWFPKKVKQAVYTYDYGDNWEHTVLFEKELVAETGQKYPRCIAGRRACPPEDCGSIWGYEELIETIKDPKHPEHKDMIRWLNLDNAREFDSEFFDPNEVEFDDPKERLKELLAHKHEF